MLSGALECARDESRGAEQSNGPGPAEAAVEEVMRVLVSMNAILAARNASVQMFPTWDGRAVVQEMQLMGLPMHRDGMAGVRCLLRRNAPAPGEPVAHSDSTHLMCTPDNMQYVIQVAFRLGSESTEVLNVVVISRNRAETVARCNVIAFVLHEEQLHQLVSGRAVDGDACKLWHHCVAHPIKHSYYLAYSASWMTVQQSLAEFPLGMYACVDLWLVASACSFPCGCTSRP